MEIKAYICCVQEDLEIAKRFYADLKKAGIRPWLDYYDILPGQHVDRAIKSAINKSDYFIALFSSNSLDRRGYFFHKSLKRVLTVLEERPPSDIFIIPLRVDDCKPADEIFQDIHWGNLFPSYENGLNEVLHVFAPKRPIKSNHIDVSEFLKPESIKTQRVELKQYLNEAKLILVGQGSVGKTSLVKRLLDNTFDPYENKTEGIDIVKWWVSINDKKIRINVWDFGGQEIMHATHQFFLTRRSLYLLVLDSRIDENENRIEYWLKIIQSFAAESPVIIVGNKIDQQPLYIDRRGLQLKYKNIKAIVETSCQSLIGIEQLQVIIKEEIGKLEHIQDKLFSTWFNIKTKLENMEKDYIPYIEYTKMCNDEGINGQISQRLLIKYLHDLGIVLNFQDDPRLEDTNILNPEWVTKGVYRILNSNELFQNKGILTSDILHRILDDKIYPKEKRMFIIDIMRKFELCFDFEGSNDKQFLIPDLLTKEEPFTGDWEKTLAFDYFYNVLPTSIMSRFIVRMNSYISKNTFWRNGVVLELSKNKALIKADSEERKIIIFIVGDKQKRRDFLSIIRSHFNTIHRSIPQIDVKEKIPLADQPEIVVDYQHLLRLEEIGEKTYIPEGTTKKINVKEFLNGIELARTDKGDADMDIKYTPYYWEKIALTFP